MTTLATILLGLGALACFARAVWLQSQPRNNDGCWLKLPGHVRKADLAFWKKKRRSA